ncbi:MAG: SulP family inorganic anion transporter [Parachlamydiales bacterium]|nr:SulP family inorganic anion transporter [Parachlamydiales bacterium]
MKLKNTSDSISFFSIKDGMASYRWRFLQRDSIAALTVALLSVPQSIAYALAANLPPTVGIFAAIFGTIFSAFFGCSRQLVIGPTNTMALLIETGVAEILYTYYRDVSQAERNAIAIDVLMELTLIVGVVQLLIAVFKLGKITQFVSRSVLVGYVSGAAIAILVDQLFYLLGVTTTHGPHSLLEKSIFFIRNIQTIHLPTAIVGVSALVFLVFMEKVNKKFPAAIVAIILSGAIVWIFGLDKPSAETLSAVGQWAKVGTVADLGELQTVIPQFAIPFFDLRVLNGLIPVGFAIALLGILETTALTRALSSETGQPLSTNQEILGLGIGNISSSFCGGMPSSGSFARSYVNIGCGAKTRMAAILSGVFSAAILIIFRKQLLQIPLAALAALLIVSTPKMVKWKEFFTCIRATRSDALVLIMTILACVVLRVDTAFYIGVILSVTLYLHKAASPSMAEYKLTKEGLLRAIGKKEGRADERIRIVHVEGEIFFGAADLLQETLKAMADDMKVRVIILHLKNARHIDATACLVVQQLYSFLRLSNRYLIASGLTRQGWEVFCQSGLTDVIGKANLFLNDDQKPHASSRVSYARALEILADQESSEIQEAIPMTTVLSSSKIPDRVT